MHALVSGVQKMGLEWNSDENRKTAGEMLKNIASMDMERPRIHFIICLIIQIKLFLALRKDS
jgi:hypothetical protein